MPLTLYRYILREILKLLATSTGVLMIVMSFGFAIKPISQGMLDPYSTVKVIIYTMPGMLTFALPFGAIFASTIVFFRMSNDNEVTACAVSGLSYREVLMPVLGLAVVLTMSMFFLSNFVVPKFWQAVARLVEQDVTKLIVSKIEHREPIAIGNGTLLYADAARDNQPIPKDWPAGKPKPHNRMVLEGVAVVKLSYTTKRAEGAERGSPPIETLHMAGELTARRAIVDLYIDRETDRTYMTLLLEDVVMYDARSGTLVAAASQPIEAQEIESPFQQKPKFLSLPHLHKVANNPDRSVMIRKEKSKLIHAIAAHQVASRVAKMLEANGEEVRLNGVNGELYFIRAPQVDLKGDRIYLTATDNRKVRVRSQVGGLTHQRMVAESARVNVNANDLTTEPTINIELTDVTISDPALPTRSVQRTEAYVPLLSIDNQVLAPLRQIPSQELVEYDLSGVGGVGSSVLKARLQLETAMVKLNRAITSCLHERAAFAINCLLVLILGSVMSMTLRHELPLVIFFWSFIPAVISILTITSGQSVFNEPKNPLFLGALVTWSGNFILIFIIGLVYRKLRRN